MAFRTWVRLLLATLGVGALAGASQLGVAYGLGILRLTRVLDVTMRDQWTAQLAWVAWFAMVAAVVGAQTGSRLLRRWSPTRPGTAATVAIALAAGIGAAVVAPLTMQPARTAQIDGVHPVFVIGLCAGLGALAGVFAAAGAIQPVSRWSLTTFGVSIWVIAIISVSPSLAPDDPLPAVRLGVFDAEFLPPAVLQRTAPFTMPALALIAGVLLGWVAGRRELPMLTTAMAGLPGPALLTVAYLIAGPGSGEDRYQVVPYWAAMTATGAGVLGSVLATVLRRGTSQSPIDENAPRKDRPPLRRRTSQAESAIALAAGPEPEPRRTDSGVIYPSRSAGPSVAGPRTGTETEAGLADTSSVRPGEWPDRSDQSQPGYPGPTGHIDPVRRQAAAESPPYLPDARPLPPEVTTSAAGSAQSQQPSRLSNTRLGRSLRLFSRSHVDPAAEDLKPADLKPADLKPADLNLSARSDRPGPGQDQDQRGAAKTDPPVRKPRGRRRGKSPDPLDTLHPVADRAFPTGASTRPLYAGAPIRDDRTPVGRPFAPQPHTISAPLPHPQPITPPVATPKPLPPSPTDNRRSGKRQRWADDYVDWVSGLGGE